MECTPSCCLLQNTSFFPLPVLLPAQDSTYSPIFCRSPPRPVYNVRQPLNTDAYLWGHRKQGSESQRRPSNNQKSPDGLPFGEPDDVPGLNQVAHVVPDRDVDAAGFVGYFAGPNLVSVLCLGHSAWRKQTNAVAMVR